MFGTPGNAGYDRTIMYSPDGRIIQAEYAREAVRRGSSVIAIKCPEGITMLAENRSVSKLIEASEKISQIDDNLYIAFSGLLSDSKVLIKEAQVFSQINRITYGEECDVESLAWRISKIAQKITQFGGRPFGVTLIIAGINNSKPEISVVEPSGAKYEAKAIAIGREDTEIMSYLESNYRPDMNLEESRKLAEEAFLKINKDHNDYEILTMDFKNQEVRKDMIKKE
ncbi:MAG: archaeal proteasome endopeptidase complex subunit alpha [Candidatus Lokiarchaeota archaeon]|nr:archaeal proteasome endopeptidase complex subunit alpha [Candidatus Lokiarchaeota archaeon]